ncbi:MAG TPA: metal-dependent hydrolase [Trinickia sp.]|uniref:metal-dependent hydrolase n=1 Tax=Trinickia sp. TaxID=2571163 RepID=UPI002B8B6862|nr:metal-dependent hydrolase [Trinickia sp.]HVW48881.1 metal-dependent hydrolase [Trinickia sp.]
MSDAVDTRGRLAIARRWNRTYVRSRFFDALSLLLPPGEAFLIETLETWRVLAAPLPDATLEREIERFVREEHTHRQAHQRYNDAMAEDVPQVRAVMQRAGRVTDELGKMSLPMRLALVAAFEHLTAVLAEEIGSNDNLLIDDPSRASRLWRWHAREELDHRHVAIDVCAHAGVRPATLRLALLLATAYLALDLARYTVALCRCDIRAGAGRRAMLFDALRFAASAVPSFARMTRGWCRFVFAPLDRAL